MLNDFRYAIRMLRKNPGFTAVAILTLALGIGGTTAIFSVIYGAVLNPWPYADTDRIAVLVTHDLKNPRLDRWAFVSPAEFLDYQEQNHVFDHVFGGVSERVLLTGRDTPALWGGMRTTPNTFRVLGMPPVIGRTITDDDARPGAPPVVVLNYKVWQKKFSGDPGIIGQTLILNRQPTTVIGVMPPQFEFYGGDGGPDCWLPAIFSKGGTNDSSQFSPVLGHLKPEVTLEQASADLEVLTKHLAAIYPKSHPSGITFSVTSLTEAVVTKEFRSTLIILMGGVGLLLLIACVNVANLLLARATARQKELAVRAAMGASRGRLVRQMLIESLLLALGGSIFGSLLVWYALQGIVAIIPSWNKPGEAMIGINRWALLFAVGMALVSTLLAGLMPAVLAVKRDLHAPLKSSGRGSGESSRHHQLRAWLVVIEVALSLVLLSGAGLLIRSFFALQQVKLGYNTDHTFSVLAFLPEDQYNTPERRIQFQLEFLRSLRATPGVVDAALNTPPYTWVGFDTAVQIVGQDVTEERRVHYLKVGDRFFEAVGIPIMQGRGISEEDLVHRRKVAVVNHAFVRRYFGTENPLGRLVKVVAYETEKTPSLYQVEQPWFEIVGVSADSAVTTWTTLDHVGRSELFVYVCYTVDAGGYVQVTVRTTANPNGLENSLRRASAALDRELPLNIWSLEEQRQMIWFSVPRFLTTMFVIFSCLGLILVCVGVFGVLSYAVSQRTQEIGIRMALGAEATDVRRMVMMSGLRWLLVGIGIGVPASIALAKILQNRIWGIKSADPLTLVVVSLLLTAVGLAACYFPARRATKVDPMEALRYE